MGRKSGASDNIQKAKIYEKTGLGRKTAAQTKKEESYMSGTATKNTPRKKNVSIIQSQKEYSKEVHPDKKILRVAAYCRVSTLL